MKSSDVQSGPEMGMIISKAGGSGVRINKACGQEEKKIKVISGQVMCSNIFGTSNMFANNMYVMMLNEKTRDSVVIA